jgi:hypothetical protein
MTREKIYSFLNLLCRQSFFTKGSLLQPKELLTLNQRATGSIPGRITKEIKHLHPSLSTPCFLGARLVLGHVAKKKSLWGPLVGICAPRARFGWLASEKAPFLMLSQHERSTLVVIEACWDGLGRRC